MRVGLITTPDLACETGSTLHARDLAAGLAAQGHEVEVLCASLPARAPSGVRFHSLPLPLEHPVFVDRPVSSARLHACVRLLSDALAAIHAARPLDVVHGHYSTFTAAAGALASWLYGIPLVVSTFGRDLAIGARSDSRYLHMTRASLREARRVIAATRALADEVAAYGVPPANVSVLPMGIDEALFARPQDGARLRRERGAPELLLVVTASAFGPEKGLDLLLRAMARSPAARRATLWILGEDDEPRRANLERLRTLGARLELLGRVVFCGRVAHDAVPEYLAAADLVIDPRLLGNYSSSMLEALALGRPVLASDAANEWGALRHGVNGYMFPAGDEDRLAARLEELLADAALRQSLAAGARSAATSVVERFRMETVARATGDVYAAAVADARAAP